MERIARREPPTHKRTSGARRCGAATRLALFQIKN